MAAVIVAGFKFAVAAVIVAGFVDGGGRWNGGEVCGPVVGRWWAGCDGIVVAPDVAGGTG